MGCVFRVVRCLILITSCLMFFIGCAEQSEGLPVPVKQEHSIDFFPASHANIPQGNASQINSADRINSDPPVVNPVVNPVVSTAANAAATAKNDIFPAAIWSAASSIWNTTLSTNVNNEIYGPQLAISETGNHFISLHKNGLLDSNGSGFVNQTGLVFSKENEQGSWSADRPYATDAASGTANVQLKVNPLTAGAYALWTRDGSLYLNRKTSEEAWGREMLIWQREVGKAELRMIELLVDGNGDAWVVWVNGSDVNISQFISTTDAGLQPPHTAIVNNALVFTTPIISSSGAVSLSWVTIPEDPFLPNLLALMRYVPGAGWSAVNTASPMNTENPMSSHLSMIVMLDETLTILVQDAFGRIFSTQFDPVSFWSNWENVDYNIGRDDIVAHSAKLASTIDGSVMAIWEEESAFINTAKSTHIYASVFNPTGDANGVHWPAPELVGTTAIRVNPNATDQVYFKTFPLLKMMPDGRAVAVWLDTTDQVSSLYANYFLPGTGWRVIPDQVVSYNRVSEGLVRSADLAITPAGNVYISWQQLISTEFAKQYQFWISDTSL